MKRVKLRFVDDIEVYFVDREEALKRVEEWAEKGTRFVQVVYGPEGCGKTAWLKQSAELLKELGFDVIYIDPLHRDFVAYTDLREIIEKLIDAASDIIGRAEVRLASLAIDLVKYALRKGRKRVAVLVDDVFQAIGLDKAAVYVKGLLGLIEYPPTDYERIVAVVATSEGVSRYEIGRHRWAEMRSMWNMSREGFLKLYDSILGEKPSFKDLWRLSGGNPAMLAKLYKYRWDHMKLISDLVIDKKLTASFLKQWRIWLEKAVEDPDTLWEPDAPEELVRELIKRNLIIYFLPERDPWFWIDQPPPQRDPELGIGRYIAWQTPLHREAVKTALQAMTSF